ncbi:MAG: SdpI family protein [Oscillospiraceae bacterium]|nr:SdpI family protein [Oscillospiraceae bacterium]
MESENLIESLIALVNEFDFAKMMPELDSVMGWIDLFVRLCVLAAPVAVLFFGLWWLILPPKEANHHVGYRCFFGMGSVDAWRFTQKIAGVLFTVLGVGLLAISLLVSNRFPDMEPMVMLDKAVVCILWQIGITLVLSLMINLIVALRYDRNGDLRSEKSINDK